MSIKLKDFKKALETALEQSKKEIQDRQNMQQIGNNLANDIRKRTQLGYGVRSSEGPREKLKPLSKSYVDQRRGKLGFWTNKNKKPVPIKPDNKKNKAYLAQNKPSLSSNTSPKKSNLTHSGRMLRSIGALVTGAGRVVIGFKTQKRARIAAYVSKMRPFFFVTKNESKRAQKYIQKKLTELIKRNIRKNF